MLFVYILMAFPYLTGYAGSPVSNGFCASTCHGSGSFQVTVSGFPNAYAPNKTYQITVTANSGTIKNFNSCILDLNNQPVGTLQGSSNTSTYSHPGEGTGIHGSVYDQSSYTFSWTAPNQDAGIVKLYMALHQGNHGGPNQALTIEAFPQTFLRGDVNGDLAVTFTDLMYLGTYLFLNGPAPDCMDAADVNDDGMILSSDISYLGSFLYLGGPPPQAPYPECGIDPTADGMECGMSPCMTRVK